MLGLVITFGDAVSPTAPLPVRQPPPLVNEDTAAAIVDVAPSEASRGDSVRVDYELTTTTGFRGNINVDTYVSDDATIQPGADRRVSTGVDGLQSDSAGFAQFFTVPSDLEPGDYWVGVAIVSPSDANPVNDVSGARRLTVTGGAPAAAGVILNSVTPAIAGLRGPLDVDFTLTNSGEPASVAYFIFISTDSTITDDDTLVRTWGPAGRRPGSATATKPAPAGRLHARTLLCGCKGGLRERRRLDRHLGRDCHRVGRDFRIAHRHPQPNRHLLRDRARPH